MKKFLILILPLFLSAGWNSAKVERIIDGDTIIIKTLAGQSQKVRLIGFDTPESFKNKKLLKQASRCSVTLEKMQMVGNISKRYTSTRLTKGSKIAYLDYGVDYFQRRLIWVRGFNYRIVADGFAKAYRRADLPRSIKSSLRKAELSARKNKKGIWSLFDKNARCY